MTGNSPLLSFLCVSYNHEKFIEDCIKSIWNNDYKNIEILLRLMDVSKINKLGWCAKTKLEDGLKIAYQDFLSKEVRSK